jgi:uncharacterized protein
MSKANQDYPHHPIPFTQVSIKDTFWTPRIKTSCEVTVPYDFEKCETTGRIDNFAKAGDLIEGAYEGLWFNDSDVFKVIEGAAYALLIEPNAQLESYLDALIAKIAAAQESDGYLYTPRTIDPENVPANSGTERWSNLAVSHELYNVGHMYEAAVAFFQATGKRSLLAVAIKSADLIASLFGEGGIRDVPGHQEIEMGLAKLYRATGDEKYLNLAKFFLDERGVSHGRLLSGEYTQDHMPVVEQREAVGHSVRAIYMYAGMADVAALTGERAYIAAIQELWENVVQKKLALTGGLGARHEGEAFGANYELPNLTAYNETCAAIASVFWNHRLFLLTGEAKYIDVLERTLYNGFLSGISLDGKSFFYVNPLSSDGQYHFNSDETITRQGWFSCSCCPTNVVRLLPSLSGYIYTVHDTGVYVNLYMSNKATIQVDNTEIGISQETNYPWDGWIKLSIHAAQSTRFSLRLRRPGWSYGQPVPSDLYRYVDSDNSKAITVKLDGQVIAPKLVGGYLEITHDWQGHHELTINIPMPIQRVVADENVQELVGKVALERGPIVYALEGIDHNCDLFDVVLNDKTSLIIDPQPTLLGGITTIIENALDRSGEQPKIVAIPYYAWGHRGVNKMSVWMNREQ